MAIDQNFFRQVMGRFATGVTVVTTQSNEGLAGLTVNSFTSVSLDPPLVLICVDLTSTTLPFIRKSGIFAVNILTEQQEALSRCFATASDERYEHFCHAEYHTATTGAPILNNVLAFLDVRVVAEYPGGDHVIFLGQVEALGIGDQTTFTDEHAGLNGNSPTEPDPLTYYRGHYMHLAPGYSTPSLPPVQAHEQHIK